MAGGGGAVQLVPQPSTALTHPYHPPQVCGVGELVLRPSFGEASWTLASDTRGTSSGTEV